MSLAPNHYPSKDPQQGGCCFSSRFEDLVALFVPGVRLVLCHDQDSSRNSSFREGWIASSILPQSQVDQYDRKRKDDMGLSQEMLEKRAQKMEYILEIRFLVSTIIGFFILVALVFPSNIILNAFFDTGRAESDTAPLLFYNNCASVIFMFGIGVWLRFRFSTLENVLAREEEFRTLSRIFVLGSVILTVMFHISLGYGYVIQTAAPILSLILTSILLGLRETIYVFVFFVVTYPTPLLVYEGGLWDYAEIHVQAQIVQTWSNGLLWILTGLLMTVSFHRMFSRLKETLQMKNKFLQDSNTTVLDLIKQREDLLAMCSHELRTPLIGIVAGLDLLEQTTLTDDQKDLMEVIRTSSDAQLSLVDDLLHLSKLDAGKIKLHMVDFDPTRLITSTLALLNPRTHQRNIKLILRKAPDAPEVLHSDPRRIRQVMINLIGNAIKFSKPNGEVTITISTRPFDNDTHYTQGYADGFSGIDPRVPQDQKFTYRAVVVEVNQSFRTDVSVSRVVRSSKLSSDRSMMGASAGVAGLAVTGHNGTGLNAVGIIGAGPVTASSETVSPHSAMGDTIPPATAAKMLLQELVISIRDNGVGVARKNAMHIFESFQQADSSISRNYGGTGLGLSIVRKLVKLLRGSLTLISKPGSFSEFVFTIVYVSDSPVSRSSTLNLNEPAQMLPSQDITIMYDNSSTRLSSMVNLNTQSISNRDGPLNREEFPFVTVEELEELHLSSGTPTIVESIVAAGMSSRNQVSRCSMVGRGNEHRSCVNSGARIHQDRSLSALLPMQKTNTQSYVPERREFSDDDYGSLQNEDVNSLECPDERTEYEMLRIEPIELIAASGDQKFATPIERGLEKKLEAEKGEQDEHFENRGTDTDINDQKQQQGARKKKRRRKKRHGNTVATTTKGTEKEEEKNKTKQPKVLVVDDNLVNCKMASRMLTRLNCNVEYCQSGKEAVQKVTSGNVQYQAILMDVMMPEMDGMEAAQAIRAYESKVCASHSFRNSGGGANTMTLLPSFVTWNQDSSSLKSFGSSVDGLDDSSRSSSSSSSPVASSSSKLFNFESSNEPPETSSPLRTLHGGRFLRGYFDGGVWRNYIIAVTAMADNPEVEKACLDAGMDLFTVKPFRADVLSKIVDGLIE